MYNDVNKAPDVSRGWWETAGTGPGSRPCRCRVASVELPRGTERHNTAESDICACVTLWLQVAQHEMYREVAIQSSLQHHNIVHLFAAFQVRAPF